MRWPLWTRRQRRLDAAVRAQPEGSAPILTSLPHEIPPAGVVPHERDWAHEASLDALLFRRHQNEAALRAQPEGTSPALNLFVEQIPLLGIVGHERDFSASAALDAELRRGIEARIALDAQREGTSPILNLLAHEIPPLGISPHLRDFAQEGALDKRLRRDALYGHAVGAQDENAAPFLNLLILEIPVIPPGLGPVTHERDWQAGEEALRVSRLAAPRSIFWYAQAEGTASILHLQAHEIPPLGIVVHQKPQGMEEALLGIGRRQALSYAAADAHLHHHTPRTLLLEEPPPAAPSEARSRILHFMRR